VARAIARIEGISYACGYLAQLEFGEPAPAGESDDDAAVGRIRKRRNGATADEQSALSLGDGIDRETGESAEAQ